MQVKQPKKLNIDPSEFTAILETVQPHLTKSQYTIIESAFLTLAWLLNIIKGKNCSIAKLRNLVFGKRTESLKNLKDLAKRASESPSNINQSLDTFLAEESIDETEEIPSSDEGSILENNESNLSLDAHLEEEVTKKMEGASSVDKKKLPNSEAPTEKDTLGPIEPLKKKGHGRRPLSDYNVTKITHILCNHLKPGDICPECRLGKLYGIEPQLIITVTGRNSLEGAAHVLEGFRCNRCMHIFRAVLPIEIATQSKADFSAKAIVCLYKYQLGVPLYRLEAWQKIQHMPISDSEMWEWTEEVALILQPVHQALMNMAAASRVIHNDDTTSKVLDLMAENVLIQEEEARNPKKKKDKERVGIYTTALLAKKDGHEISIYITGRKNAGENLDALLDKRPKSLEKPIQACDASSSNKAEKHETLMAKCFNHARHNFCELVEFWPKECLSLIELMNEVFINDRETKEMSSEDRQKYHEQHSTPVMDKIKSYSNGLIKNKIAEPNSNLGKAIAYLNNHWEGLTVFLKNGEAPLTNNACERTIKPFVNIRKNSYFYKTLWGAMVGDTLLSIIHTCKLNQINPHDYLVAAQANARQVHKNPEAWLPWNYTQNISCPYVNAAICPKEEIYQHSSSGPPIITPINAPAIPEKKTLRDRGRDFFRSFYPKKPKKNQSSCSS